MFGLKKTIHTTLGCIYCASSTLETALHFFTKNCITSYLLLAPSLVINHNKVEVIQISKPKKIGHETMKKTLRKELTYA